ncbi:MAG: integration host factor subunit beta [Acidobacteria bacterium]|nr:integration host factor subunit beta [Acidobacteriota bacterium]
MIKIDIAENITKRVDIPRVQALKAVDEILEKMKEALARGERIEIRGFGVFQKKMRKQSVGRDILRSKTIAIPETYTIKFKPGIAMKVLD